MRNNFIWCYWISLALWLGCSGCGSNENYDAGDVLEMAHISLEGTAQGRWFVTSRHKGFDAADTNEHRGTLFFSRKKTWHQEPNEIPKINLLTSDGGVLILNDSLLFLAEKREDPVSTVSRSLYGTTQMDQLPFRKLVPNFLIGKPYGRWRETDYIISRKKDSTVGNTRCWVLEFELRSSLEEQIKRRLAIGKKDSLPRWVETRVDLLDQFQYETLLIEPLYKGVMPQVEFGEDAIPKSRIRDIYAPKEADGLLENGEVVPDFERPTLDDKTFKIADYKGHLILLDFWYMGCQPCRKAFPYLTALHNDFGDKGLKVVGVNPIDPLTENFKGFVEKHALNYTLLPAATGINKLYNVDLYPTLYLVDKNGKVADSWLGHGEADLFFGELRKQIELHLKDEI